MTRTSCALILLALIISGCRPRAAATPDVDELMGTIPKPAIAEEPVPPTMSSGKVVVLGQSVKGKPIEMHLFGPAPSARRRPVLIFAAIHGNETTTVHLTQGLIRLLSQSSSAGDFGDRPIAIIPIANPDGLSARTRTNANKVDINRNFPAENWSSSGKRTSYFNGPAPASEPETRAIMRAVEEYRPMRICTIHSIDRGRQCNNYDGPGKALAEAMSNHNGYPPAATIGYPTPGSFGSWAGIDRQIPTITLELPRTTSGPKAWQDNREALIEFIRFGE